MITLGIDPGSLITGYGVIEMEQRAICAVAFGVIRTDAKQTMPFRLKKIYDDVDALISRYRPKRLSIETAFYGKNVQSALKLGQARGAIIALAMSRGLDVAEYSPREVKKALSGTGGAAKEQVAFMVKKILNLSDTGKFSDASDALGIALCDALRKGTPTEQQSLELSKSRNGSRQAKSNSWKNFLDANPHRLIQS
jgi:crossover junction endodeoxyribonuclease RuvC